MIKMSRFLLCALSILITLNVRADILDDVRKNYSQMTSNENMCKKAIANLKVSKNVSATHLVYLGALQTIWANYVLNPLAKLNTFNEGKKNIEQAIKKEPSNAELRFIRLSVQQHAPSFLGYNANIKEDILFININRNQIKSAILYKYIELLLNE